MSVQALTWAMRQEAPSPGAKAVLIVLANYADEEGCCYPSQKTLARVTQYCERAVRRHLADLEAAGLISRQSRRREDGTFSSDTFRLEFDQRQNLPSAKSASGTKCRSQRQNLPVEPAAKSAAYTKDYTGIVPYTSEEPSEGKTIGAARPEMLEGDGLPGGVPDDGGDPFAIEIDPAANPPSGRPSTPGIYTLDELPDPDEPERLHPIDLFWNLAPAAQKAGISRSMMGKLIREADDPDEAYDILRAALKKREPRAYVAKIVATRKLQYQPDPDEPECIREARYYHAAIERRDRDHWIVNGMLLNRNGDCLN